MNKKLRKILATVSAVAVCAVSMTAITAGAVSPPACSLQETVNQYTTSFTANGVEYTLWEEATDYFDDEYFKVYISEPLEYEWHGEEDLEFLVGSTCYYAIGSHHQIWEGTTPDKAYDFYNTCSFYLDSCYRFDNEKDADEFENYLLNNNIYMENDVSSTLRDSVKYTRNLNNQNGITSIKLYYPLGTTVIDKMQTLINIKEDTGLAVCWGLLESTVSVTDVVNALPEVTLSGDSDCDNKVNINDAVLVMQTIANPDKYSMTMQGIANADVVGDGDGVTLSDAMAIQDIAASHAFD